jgi:hypothetical protein
VREKVEEKLSKEIVSETWIILYLAPSI